MTEPSVSVPVNGVIVVEMVSMGQYTAELKQRLVKVKLKDREEGGVRIVREKNMFIKEPLAVRSVPESPPKVIDVFVGLLTEPLPTKVMPRVSGQLIIIQPVEAGKGSRMVKLRVRASQEVEIRGVEGKSNWQMLVKVLGVVMVRLMPEQF